MGSEKRHNASEVIRTRVPRTTSMEHVSPLYLSSSFCYQNAEEMRAVFAGEEQANIYSRFINPSVTEFQNRMCVLEDTEAAMATASGMSANFATFMSLLSAGDHLISGSAIFGSTHSMITRYLPKWGIEHSFFDMRNPEVLEKLVRPETKLLYVETPSNPGLDLTDLALLSTFAKAHDLIFVVDNTFASPIFQQPRKFGADLIIHSATKWIDGQGRTLGGVVCGPHKYVDEIFTFCRNTGPSLSAFNAWLLSSGLETLTVRMEKHAENAMILAEWLAENHHVANTRYPFLPSHPQYELAKKQMKTGGGVVCFEVKGGLAQGKKFLDSLKMLSVTANLGDVRSIASHPASTTHAKLSEEERQKTGIMPGLIRVSVGLEDVEDVIADIDQALANSK